MAGMQSGKDIHRLLPNDAVYGKLIREQRTILIPVR